MNDKTIYLSKSMIPENMYDVTFAHVSNYILNYYFLTL